MPITKENLEGSEEFEKREVTIGPTTFYINKMLAREAYAVLEILRPSLGDIASKITPSMEWVQIVGLVLKHLPPPILRVAEDSLFEHVKFENKGTMSPAILKGRVDEAFHDIEPIFIYEVLGRSLAVNFLGSLRAMMSRIESIQDSPPPPSGM